MYKRYIKKAPEKSCIVNAYCEYISLTTEKLMFKNFTYLPHLAQKI